jgi:hypothetical protein
MAWPDRNRWAAMASTGQCKKPIVVHLDIALVNARTDSASPGSMGYTTLRGAAWWTERLTILEGLGVWLFVVIAELSR